MSHRRRDLLRVAAALVARPGLWVEAARCAVDHRPDGAARGARPWLAFRAETAFGDRRALPSGPELLAYLEWTRAERRARHDARLARRVALASHLMRVGGPPGTSRS